MNAWIDAPVAKPPVALATPGPLKTRIAREVVVAVLAEAGRPMTRHAVLEAALADPKVQAAGVSRGTLSAEMTAALSESPPRLLRLGRGIYASTGSHGLQPVGEMAPQRIDIAG